MRLLILLLLKHMLYLDKLHFVKKQKNILFSASARCFENNTPNMENSHGSGPPTFLLFTSSLYSYVLDHHPLRFIAFCKVCCVPLWW